MHSILPHVISHTQICIQLIQIPHSLTNRIQLIPGICNQHSHPDKGNGFRRNSSYALGSSDDVFDFLGFTFYWGRSRKGVPMPKVKTNGKRLRSKLKAVNIWGRLVRSQFPLKHIWAVFCSKLRGHIQYYGVSFNYRAIQTFQMKATRILFK
jgi:hypothetical protein